MGMQILILGFKGLNPTFNRNFDFSTLGKLEGQEKG